ncbi:hypothetical protein GCM10010528_07580 [Gordonia defluvii]|uniref:Integral membrane protein n=1 Tax=Gordonia defluvii TaxID=283718 RepID=A0ABP6L329_9ACTN|nr:hypothetical protein [Gordonia sp. UBA5067]
MTQPPFDPGQQPINPGQPGAYPPAGQQPGAYPPAGQQPGAYPPPPPGAPGSYPPPPPGSYPPGPAAGQPFSVGDGFSWAFNKFGKNVGPLILATLVFGLILGVVSSLFQFIAAALGDTSSISDGDSFAVTSSYGVGSYLVMALGYIVLAVLSGYVAASYWNGILQIADGQHVTLGSFFQPRNVTNVIIASILVGIITGIGSILCVLPGLIAALFLYFTTIAVVDRNASATEGMGLSFNLVKDNFGQTLLVWLLAIVIVLVGAILCGVGLLVAVPVAALLVAYSWRGLTGGYVAPATP